MPPALTRRQQAILDLLCDESNPFEHPPTLDELAAALGVRSRGSLHKQVQALIEAGLVEPMNRLRRGIRLTPAAAHAARDPAGSALSGADTEADTAAINGTLPLLGRIAAGRPIEAISGHDRIEVPRALCTGEHCFVLQVYGDSMIEDGIFDGDWIIVEPRERASNGQLVVALVDEAEATVKRLQQRPGEVVLIPANSSMDPMSYAPERVRIQGIVVGQMRSYA